MTREKFVEHAFSRKSEDLLTICDQIVTSYQEQGLRLTLRQLFYVLITRNVVPSANRVYKNLSGLISMGRLVDAAIASYRLPRWEGQPYYAELWVEKDALAGILLPLAQAYHVTLLVQRGYGSTSSMYDALNPAKRTDPRAREFIRRYGESSWEVDALPPEVLDRLIRAAFDGIVDRHAMQEVIEQEERDKESLRRAVKRLRRRRKGSS